LITPAVASKALPEATQVPAHARVCAFLGVYRRREGFWKEYLESLPETFSTPPYFDEKEMEILRGTNLYFAWLDRINLWKTEYENVKTFIPELQWYIFYLGLLMQG
jgi:hypothetical protein